MTHLCPKQAFANILVQEGLILPFLTSLEMQPTSKEESLVTRDEERNRWSILESLATSPSVASNLAYTNGWLELLANIAECDRLKKTRVCREGSAKTLARLLYDPHVSTTTGEEFPNLSFCQIVHQFEILILFFYCAASLLQQFIPSTLLSILKSNGADALLLAFDADSSTPNLIWDNSTRLELRQALLDFMNNIFDINDERIQNGRSHCVPPTYKLIYSNVGDELCIGNVFVKLYIQDPSFQLSDPSVFVEALFCRWSQEMDLLIGGHADDSSHQDAVQIITDAIICICKQHPFLLMNVSGYIKAIISYLLKSAALPLMDLPLLKSIRLLHLFSRNLASVEEMIVAVNPDGTNGFVDGIMKAIGGEKLHPDTAFMIDTLKAIFQMALGEVGKTQGTTLEFKRSDPMGEEFLSMAPSPAPGLEPVSKLKKVNADHPLAMMFNDTATPKKSTRAVRPNAQISRRSSSNPLQNNPSQPSTKKMNPRTIAAARTMLSAQNLSRAKAHRAGSHQLNTGTLLKNNEFSTSQLHEQRSKAVSSSGTVNTFAQQNLAHNNLNSHIRAVSQMPSTSSLTSNIGQPPSAQVRRQMIPHAKQASHLERPYVDGWQVSNEAQTPTLSSNPTLNHYPQQMPEIYGTPGRNGSDQPNTTVRQAVCDAPVPTMKRDPPNISATYSMTKNDVTPPYAIIGQAENVKSFTDPVSTADDRTKTINGAPNSANGRILLLDTVLKCRLIQFLLLKVLDNPNINEVKEPEAAKSKSIELLHFLLKDPGYGTKFAFILNALPSWRKYASSS